MMPYDKWDFICSYPFVRVASIVTSSSGEGGGGGVGWGGVGEGCTFPYMDLIDMCRRRGCGF